MLRFEETKSRTFEERMSDAIAAIPLLSREWTNFNPSDPGITILENLIAFEALQGSYIDNPDNSAKLKLLMMAGFHPIRGKCARLLLSADSCQEPVTVLAGQRFCLGNLTFESNRKMKVGDCHLTGVFGEFDGKLHNLSHLADREYIASVRIFGKTPKEGDCLYFISDQLPESEREVSFYFTKDDTVNRNPVVDRTENIFASLKWEVFTDIGFQEIKTRDFTGAFLTSGEIKMRIPGEKAVLYEELPVKGYCLRATLKRAAYDIPPRLISVHGFLFEVWQRRTRSMVMTFHKNKVLKIKSPLADEGYVLVFGKEEKGSSYRRYEITASFDMQGRYCRYEKEKDGSFTLTFDRDRFGFEPEKLKDAIRVVLYSEEIMRQYRVGTVLGYDNQELPLPLKRIVPETFCLIAKRTDPEGEARYDFVRPERTGDDDLCYHLMENDGTIVIEDAGAFIGAELFMGGIAVTEGAKGNVRAGSSFSAPGITDEEIFYNPGEGTGGMYRETLEEVKERFRKDVYTPYTCVTAGDYEHMALTTPGLCIKKAHAVMDERENVVHITVMPDTGEAHPKLSENYRKAIADRIEIHRLITTRFQIMPPIYCGVAVRSTVYVKSHYGDCRQIIEERFREAMDYENTEKNFGDVLSFEEVFRYVEDLGCVDYIYELSMRPENPKGARLVDSDIHPVENCLLHLGHIDLEIITYSE